jgi:hypothetical protein
MSAVVPVTVVVAFSSRGGATETRALAAAVGAVNARALIRMRRMPDVEGGAAGGESAELLRMRKEYVPPTEADIVGAEALVVAVPRRAGVDSTAWAPLATILRALADQGKLHGKVASVVAGGDPAHDAEFATFLLALGFVLVPPAASQPSSVDDHLALIQAHGRRVADVARALKAAT